MFYELTKKVDSLTAKQASRLSGTRQEFFHYATSSDTRLIEAAKAALSLVELLPNNGGIRIEDITNCRVNWFPNPDRCREYYKSLGRIRVFTHSLRDSIELSPIYWRSLSDRLLNSITSSLNNNLLEALWSGRNTPLSESLYECAWNSLVDLPWVAQYLFLSEFPEVKLPGEVLVRLHALKAVLIGSFAVWVAPKNIILCNKPIRVELQDNQVAGLEFED